MYLKGTRGFGMTQYIKMEFGIISLNCLINDFPLHFSRPNLSLHYSEVKPLRESMAEASTCMTSTTVHCSYINFGLHQQCYSWYVCPGSMRVDS